MSTLLTYSLLALVGFLTLLAALLAAPMIRRAFPATQWDEPALQRLDRLEIAFEGFAAQYALSNTQHAAQLGKLRRALARERGEEEEEDTPPPPPEVLPSAAEPVDQMELRRQYFRGRVA